MNGKLLPRVPSFLFRVLLLWVACAVLICAALALGRAQPLPEALQTLHLTDCTLPCWLGIVPGQTTFDEGVYRVIKAYPQSYVMPETSQLALGIRIEVPFGRIVFGGGNDGLIREIFLTPTQLDSLELGDVVVFLGAPANSVGSLPHSAFYKCANALAIVAVGGVAGGWQQPLGVISIRGNGPETCTIARR